MPGLRAALPAALLLLSSFPPAAAEQHPWPQAPGVMHPLNPNSREAAWAARTVLHYTNYRTASPSLLWVLHHVEKATVRITPGGVKKYYLRLTIRGYMHEKDVGSCSATVLYLKNSPPQVRAKCVHAQDKKQIQEADYRLYKYLQSQKKPITANSIPDSYGNIDRDHLSLLALAKVGTSCIMWKKSTEHMGYFLAQVKAAKQQLRTDDAVEFNFIVLLHEMPTQEMVACNMNVLWTLNDPMRVKYTCAPDNHELEDGSGQDSGSAAGTSHETKGNF